MTVKPPITQKEWDERLEKGRPVKFQIIRTLKLNDLQVNGLVVPADYDFSSVDLSNSEISSVKFDHCRFSSTKLAGCVFTDAEFNKCEWKHLSFSDCQLNLSRFKDNSIFDCEFAKADMSYVDFGNSILSDCKLETADMSTCWGFVLDHCKIENTRLPVRSSDPWSQLLRTYTGANFVFNSLILLVFFAPFVIKGLGLIALGHIEVGMLRTIYEINDRLPQGAGPTLPKTLPKPDQICALLHCQEIPVWRVLLGSDTSVWAWMIGVALLVYNVLRAFLTYRVALLKDEQQASRVTPRYKSDFSFEQMRKALRKLDWKTVQYEFHEIWHSYAPLWRIHKAILIMWWLTIVVLIWRLIEFFSATVFLPA